MRTSPHQTKVPLRWRDGPAADDELAHTLLLLEQRHLDILLNVDLSVDLSEPVSVHSMSIDDELSLSIDGGFVFR